MIQIDNVFCQIFFFFVVVNQDLLTLAFCRNNTNPMQFQIITNHSSEIKTGFHSICRLEIKMFKLYILITFTEQFFLLIDRKLFTLLSEIAVYYSYDRIIIFYFILELIARGIIISVCCQTLRPSVLSVL